MQINQQLQILYWSSHNTAEILDIGEPQTFKEIPKYKNVALWKLSAIVVVNNFLSCKAWILLKLFTAKEL